jgi:transporter family-2 protein
MTGLSWSFAGGLIMGLMIPLQALVNTRFAAVLGHPMVASMFSFIVGAVTMIACVLLMRLAWPSPDLLSKTHWWMWIGGVLGASYVSGTIFLTPKLGALTLFALLVAGQLISSVIFDHFGWFGLPVHPANPMRMIGIVLIIAALYLIRRF